LRLSPLDPRLFVTQAGFAHCHFFKSQYDEAASWIGPALREQPDFLTTVRISIACNGRMGRLHEVRKDLARAREIAPTMQRISDHLAGLGPYQRAEDIAKLAEGFRLAGMPE
jgi:hypothetical protein